MPKAHAFSFSPRDVDHAGSSLSFQIPDAWIAGEIGACGVSAGRGSFEIHVAPLSPGFYLTGMIDLRVEATCVRCLRPARLELSIPFKVHMTPGPPLPDDESAGEDGSLGVGRYQGEEIVLDSLVRESIVLALPMNPTCPGGCSIDDLYRDDG